MFDVRWPCVAPLGRPQLILSDDYLWITAFWDQALSRAVYQGQGFRQRAQSRLVLSFPEGQARQSEVLPVDSGMAPVSPAVVRGNPLLRVFARGGWIRALRSSTGSWARWACVKSRSASSSDSLRSGRTPSYIHSPQSIGKSGGASC